MGKLQQQLGNLNENDVLRELISACEKSMANLSAQSARDVLVNAEDAHQLLARLSTTQADVRAELARLESIDDRLVKSANKIVSLVGGSQAYAVLRQQTQPNSEAQRWHLDAVIADKRRAVLRQLGIVTGVFALVLLLGYAFRATLFPPDPSGQAISKAQQELAGSDNAEQLSKAIAAIDVGLTIVPTDTMLLLWRGALQEKQTVGSGQAAFNAARAHVDERDYLLNRAQVFYMLNLPQRTLNDMNALLAKTPDIPEAYYVRAGAYESLKERGLAIADLNKCADLAQAQGNDTLVATARVRLGMMMQQN